MSDLASDLAKSDVSETFKDVIKNNPDGFVAYKCLHNLDDATLHMDGTLLTHLADDLKDAKFAEPFIDKLKTKPELVESWKTVKYCGDDELAKLATNIDELDVVAKNTDEITAAGGYKAWKSTSIVGKSKIISKLDDLGDLVHAKNFVNSLDDVADASILTNLDVLSDAQLQGLNNFYKNRVSAAGFTKTDYNFKALKTLRSGEQVSITYRYGFAQFHNTNYCPSFSFLDGSSGRFKYVDDALKVEDYNRHYTE